MSQLVRLVSPSALFLARTFCCLYLNLTNCTKTNTIWVQSNQKYDLLDTVIYIPIGNWTSLATEIQDGDFFLLSVVRAKINSRSFNDRGLGAVTSRDVGVVMSQDGRARALAMMI